MASWKARGRLPISANWTFLPALTVEALWVDVDRNCGVRKDQIVVLEREVGHFERKFQGEGGRPSTTFGVRKLESLGYLVALFAWSYV